MFKPKDLHFGIESMDKVFNGVDKVYQAVSSTLGLYAHTVVIEQDVSKEMSPDVTKDGVTVAKSIDLPDQLEQLGAKLILQASKQADSKSGDGTTTTVVLGHAATAAAIKLKKDGVLAVRIRDMLEETRDWIVDELISVSKQYPINDDTFRNVALVSGNGEKRLADVAIAAYNESRGGMISVHKTRNEEDELIVKRGSVISGRPLTFDCVSRTKPTVFEFPQTCVVNGYVDLNTLDLIVESETRDKTIPTVIFAHQIRDEVEETVNHYNSTITRNGPLVILPCPGVGSNRQVFLTTMTQMLACTAYEIGQNEIKFGTCKSVIVEPELVIIHPDSKYDEQSEVARIREMRDVFAVGTVRYNQMDEIVRFVLGRRVTINVGGLTESEITERHARMVDAVRAIDLVQYGVIPGGGTVLAAMLTRMPEELRAFESVLIAPMAKILANGGLENSAAFVRENAEFGTCRDYTSFYELRSGEYIDLVNQDIPVFDPVRVTVNAVRAAFSVASNIVSSNCYIVEHDYIRR